MDWDRNTIVSQLIKETKLCEQFYGTPGITEEEAKLIAREAEKRIKDMNVKFLSGPLSGNWSILSCLSMAILNGETSQLEWERLFLMLTV